MGFFQMKIVLKGNKIIATAELNRKDWWLVCEKGNGTTDTSWGIWTLNRKIDRSYKGKDPDIAVASLWLEPEIAKQLVGKLDIVWI